MSGPVGVLLDLLFPPKCVFCGRLLTSGERDFCARCQRELPWLEGPEAEQTGEFFTLCASPLAYRDQVRDSIRRYKFKGRQGYHKAYGRLVAQCVHDHLDGRWDLITWV
ncbi:double zinc ribbon domain-containing protein, partial [Clostridioides difficile]|nr:double zinc ribbon domain-containing protein [Clostridioides difficile]